jgi:hypothetical protein
MMHVTLTLEIMYILLETTWKQARNETLKVHEMK